MTVEVAFDAAPPRLEEGGLDERGLAEAVVAALEHGGRADLWVSVVVVTAAALADLHERYLGDPSETDVITFELGDDEPGPAAEIYLSLDRARQVATARGGSLAREMALYAVHGALHLCGFDDREPAQRTRMRAAERAVLALLGHAPDDAPHELDDDEAAGGVSRTVVP